MNYHTLHGLLGLPIIDEQMVVLGYLDILELIMVWVRARQAPPSGQ